MLTDFDKYQTTLPYPSKADFTTTYYYQRGKLIAVKLPNKTVRYEPGVADNLNLNVPHVKEECFDEEAYKRARTAYNEDQARLHEQFKQDLFADLGIANNPKRELLYSKAYDRGHSAGYCEVYQVACDLVDLILD